MRDRWTSSFALSYLLTTADLTSVSSFDVDQVLTESLDKFQGDEMPTCCGDWTCGDTTVIWQIRPIPREALNNTIENSRNCINHEISELSTTQYNALLSLRRLYESEDADLGPDVLPERRLYNAWLDEELARVGVRREDFWPVDFDHDLPLDEFAGRSVGEIVDTFNGAVALEDELTRGMRAREEPSAASDPAGDDQPKASSDDQPEASQP